MATINEVATQFFEACEAGKGWEACKAFCTPNASSSAQAEPLAKVHTLREYADWMQGLMKMMPDGRPESIRHRREAVQRDRLCSIFRHSHRARRTAADRQKHANRLRLFDGLRWRKDSPHD
jgi:hypothetical protein